MGNITAEIFVDGAPQTGMNFVKLVENGTYDGSPFHRIIRDFMMQGGNHDGQGGSGNPDCADDQGNIPDEFSPELRHDRAGRLSMANAGAGTSSSQFFITFTQTPWLDAYEDGERKDCEARDQLGRPINSCHAVFGQVVDGMEVVEKVNDEAASSDGTPRTPVTFVRGNVEWPEA